MSRPFDATRDGFVLGEGAGSLFLEDLELAKARGAQIYAEVVGYGSAADGWDMIQPIDAGVGSARAMKMALERRGVPADEVDLINPHGTSTPLGDKREAEAIWTVFGDRAARDRKSLAISAHEVDDRPHDGRRRRVRGVRDGHVGRRAVRPAHDQLPRLRPRVRPVGRDRDQRRCRSATRSRTTSGSAATTAPSSSSATTATDGCPTASVAASTSSAPQPSRAVGVDARHLPTRTVYNPAVPVQVTSMPERDPARRAVITGLGAVMPIGNDFPTYWANLAGRRDRHADRSAASTRRRTRSGSRPRSSTSTRPRSWTPRWPAG